MTDNKPNIVFILSDDQGAWALGCAGNKELHTPNIDRLASQGMLFENFYCASPVCSPARASLLTGRIPSQHGVHDWLRDDNQQQSSIEYLQGQTSYPTLLNEAGYICGLSGKWHLGNSAQPQQGFSHWYCHQSGGGPYYNAPIYKDGQLYNEPRYVTDAITDDALAFIEEHAGRQPFYLQVGYTAPHAPWLNNHPEEYTRLYEDCPFASLPSLPRHPDSIYLTDEVAENLKANQIGYFAAVTAMDDNIGRIMQTLEQQGIAENTIVVFTSDNGFSCGHHGFWGKGNGTFPINLYESSVKVPFIVRHPNYITPGTTAKGLYSAYDFMPTLLQYVGLSDLWQGENMPGKSFAPVLQGGLEQSQEDIVIFDEYGPNRMIRSGEYKYIHRYPYGPNELFHLGNDPEENNNLLIENPSHEIASTLRAQLENWFLAYVNPEIDGAKEAVFGSGQINLAGTWAKGQPSHSCDAYIQESAGYASFAPK